MAAANLVSRAFEPPGLIGVRKTDFRNRFSNRQNHVSICLRLLLPISGHMQFTWKDTI